MLRRVSSIFAVVLATTALAVRPVSAAEEVSLAVGDTELVTLSVADLETYATTGEASKDLEAIVTLLPADQVKKLREFLIAPTQVKPEPFGQFLDSKLGSKMLNQISDVVKPKEAGVSSTDSLKTAMNTVAAQPNGFSTLDLLKAYPSSRILLDQEAASAKQKELETLGSDMGLLLAALGVNVDTSNAKLDLPAIISLVESASRYVEDVDAFVQSTGIDEAELQGDTPPTGTVTLQKADIYELYQKFSKLRQKAGQVVEDSGVEVDISKP